MKIEDLIDDGSGYGSHLPILNLIFKAYPIKNVVEFGMGNFSTKYFMLKQCELMSVEMQDENWFVNLCKELLFDAKDHWNPICELGAAAWKNIQYPQSIDLCFVDGHVDSRADCVNFMFNKALIIVAHDFECNVYHWENIIVPNNYRLIVYHNSAVQTAVYIHENLINLIVL